MIKKSILSLFAVSSIVTACGTKKAEKKVKAIYQPWTVVDSKKFTTNLLEEKTKEACDQIRAAETICSSIIKSLKSSTNTPLLNFKFISDDILKSNDPLYFDKKVSTYEYISPINNDGTKTKEQIIFTTSWDGDKGYLVSTSYNKQTTKNI